MMRRVLRSKIHRVKVTGTFLDYEGSLGVAQELMEAASLSPWEEVQVVVLSTGERFTTYASPTAPGTGVSLYGAAARLAMVNDLVIVMSFGLVSEEELAAHSVVLVAMGEDGVTVREVRRTAARADA